MAGCQIHENFNPGCEMCNAVARVRQAARDGTLTFADTPLVEKYSEEIRKIHEILGIREENVFFVSDESRIGYYPDGAAITLSEILGFKVNDADRLVDVAKMIREKSR
ncbi:MAG TPA: hypothetical protein VKH64_02825 [Candidatus Binatia bacterium]|nr:hypothetical protein [Candidatus Binatia bacterium]